MNWFFLIPIMPCKILHIIWNAERIPDKIDEKFIDAKKIDAEKYERPE